MGLQVITPGIDYMIERVMNFQTDDATDFWTAPLYRFYLQLDGDIPLHSHLRTESNISDRCFGKCILTSRLPLMKKIDNMLNMGNSTRGKSSLPCPILLEWIAIPS